MIYVQSANNKTNVVLMCSVSATPTDTPCMPRSGNNELPHCCTPSTGKQNITYVVWLITNWSYIDDITRQYDYIFTTNQMFKHRSCAWNSITYTIAQTWLNVYMSVVGQNNKRWYVINVTKPRTYELVVSCVHVCKPIVTHHVFVILRETHNVYTTSRYACVCVCVCVFVFDVLVCEVSYS